MLYKNRYELCILKGSVRLVGSKNYHSNTHTGKSFADVHDHSNNIRTVGMGEFIGVLNGIEFRTRHNDYRLKKPV